MNGYIENCLQTLRESGARITAPRRLVIQCLADAKSPLSPREILQIVKTAPDSGSLDQVSVYRILEALLELGLVHRVAPSGSFIACRHTTCVSTLHVLTRCTKCEKAVETDVPAKVVAPLLNYLKTDLKFLPQDHIFQIDGLCGSCQKK